VECTDYQSDEGVKVVNVHDYGWWEVSSLGSSSAEYLLVYEEDDEGYDHNTPISVFPIVNVFGWWVVRT